MAPKKPKPAQLASFPSSALAEPYSYEAPSWDGHYDGCRPGTLALQEVLRVTASCYADRQVPNSGGAPSTHREGRALDIGLNSNGMTHDAAQALADRLVDAAPGLQVQQIIWNLSLWRVGGKGWVPYDGAAGDHKDHLHVELTHAAAERLTVADCRAALGMTEDPNNNPYGEDMTPVLYNDANYLNVFAIFPTGEVLHISPELANYYRDRGAEEVNAGHHGQTIAGLFLKSGLDFSTYAVAKP